MRKQSGGKKQKTLLRSAASIAAASPGAFVFATVFTVVATVAADKAATVAAAVPTAPQQHHCLKQRVLNGFLFYSIEPTEFVEHGFPSAQYSHWYCSVSRLPTGVLRF